MVAYNFKPQFEEDIATLKKRQTVRSERARHARPGEAMQLYTGMRTRACRKILNPAPICIDVQPIRIHLDSRNPLLIHSIAINEVPLDDDEIEQFAVADGFGGALVTGFARQRMGEFWLRHHEWNGFLGVVIRWDPAK